MEGIEAAFAGGMVQETGIAGIVKARLVLLFTELDFQFEMVVAELFLGDIYHNASRLDEVTKNQFSSQVASAQMTKITSAMKVAANRGLYLTT